MDLFSVSNCEGDLDTTVDKVMKNIFTSCDTEKSDEVNVLDLINFIQPFMSDNESELQELQIALDPNNENPVVSSEQFYKAMGEWTKKIKGFEADDIDCSFKEINPSDLDHLDPKDLPYCQSTPRHSFGHHLVKGYQGSLNMSNISTFSLNSTNNLSTIDKTCFEEKIKELQHQVYKSNAELYLAKQQLAASEDQNDQLQNEIKKMQKQLLTEHQMTENLAKQKKEADDLREELLTVKDQNQNLERLMNLAEKDNANLKTWIQQLEVESLKWEKKYEDIVEKEELTVKHVLELKKELACKEEEINELVKINYDLNVKMKEQKDIIEHFKNTTDMLKQEKCYMEQKFKEFLSTKKDSVLSQLKSCLNNSLISLGTTQTSSLSPSTPTDRKDFNRIFEFNSPNLLKKLTHPVTELESPNVIKKTESPVETGGVVRRRNFLIKSSTPLVRPKSAILETSNDQISPILNLQKPLVLTHSKSVSNNFNDYLLPSHNTTTIISPRKKLSSPFIMARSLPNLNVSIYNVTSDVPATNGNSNLSLSSDEDIYTKLHIVNNCIPQQPHESLQSEICNAILKYDGSIQKLEENTETAVKCNTNLNSSGNSYCSVLSSDFIDKSNYVSLIHEKEILETNLSIQIGRCYEIQNELDKIKTEFATKDIEITKLKSKIEEITYEKNNLYEKLKDEIENGKKLEEIYEKFRNYESTIDSFNEKDHNNQLTIEELTKELDNTKYANSNLNSEITNLQNLNSDFKETITKLSSELEEKCTEVENLKAELDIKIKEVLDLQEEISHNVIRENLQDDFTSESMHLQSSVDHLQKDLKQKDNEIFDLQGQLRHENEIKNILWQNLQDLKTDIEQKEIKEQNFITKCSELEEELNEQKRKYENLQVTYHKVEESIGRSKSEVDSVKSDYEFKYQELKKENGEFENKIHSLSKEYQQLELESKKHKEVYNVVLQEYRNAKKELTQMQEKNIEMEINLSENSKKLDEIITEKFTLEETYNALKYERDKFMEDLEKEKLKNKKLLERCKDFEAKLIDFPKKITCLQENNEKLNKESQILTDQLQNLISFEKEMITLICNIKVILNNLPKDKLQILYKNEHDLIQNLNKSNFIKILDVLSKLLNLSNNSQENKTMTYDKQCKIIDKSEERICILEANNTELQTFNETLKKKCELLEYNIKTLNKDNNCILKENADLHSNIQELKRIEQIIGKQKLEYDQNKTDLENKIVDLSEELKLNKEQYHKLHTQLEASEKDRYVVGQKLTQATTLLIQQELDNKKIASEKFHLEKQLEKEELKAFEFRKIISDLSSARANSNELKTNLHESNAKIDEISTELAETKELAKTFDNKYHSANNKLDNIEKQISVYRLELSSATDLVLSKCKHLFEEDIWNNKLEFIEAMEPPRTKYIEFLVDKEINKMNNQIKLTTKIMELIAARFAQEKIDIEMQTEDSDLLGTVYQQVKPSNSLVDAEMQTEDSGICSMNFSKNSCISVNSEIQTEDSDYHSINLIKPIKKFTLRPSTLIISQPTSPDSKSAEFSSSTKNCSVSLFKSTKDLIHNSPDSVQPEKDVFSEILTDNMISKQAEDSDEITMANMPDEFLDRLGLLEESPRKHLSKKELEENFTALALMLTIESSTTKKRYKKQKEILKEYQKLLKQNLTEIMKLLENHICVDKAETVLPALDQLVLITSSLDNNFELAEQCGVLQMEARNIKCWNLVTNYVAMLKKDLDKANNSLLQSIKSESPKGRLNKYDKKNNTCVKRCMASQTSSPELKVSAISCESFICTSEEVRSHSSTFCEKLKPIGFTMGVALILVVGLVYYIHWKCLNSGLRNPICPLDVVFEKLFQPKMIGRPPF